MPPATTACIALLLAALAAVPATVRAAAPDPPTFMLKWGGLMAGSTLSVLPVLVLLIFLGRRLVQSLSFSGIK